MFWPSDACEAAANGRENGRVIRKHLIVHGTVQGVGFRFQVDRAARALGLNGYARNLFDGTVEVEIEGDADAADQLIAVIKASPGSSTVTSVDVSAATPRGDHGFTIR